MLSKINLADAVRRISRTEDPHIVGEVNDCVAKLVRLHGPFMWHHHANEDELFLVLKGELEMNVRETTPGTTPGSGAGATHATAGSPGSAFVERRIVLREGEMIVIPRGVEHQPIAHEECHILLFEPGSTLNTGNVRNEKTRDTLTRL